MTDQEYEQLIAHLGQLREQSRRLAETDYATAMYKGYSSDGLTLTEVQEAIDETEERIRRLEEQLEDNESRFN